ncbi:hypothetical protein PPYR_15554 [Photinus pyralis]|uniref:Endonuclease/exonuclease/phosphatase domain-containing protein n=1 Tax=Photinus pyralis TaxID=7054 RepID=A0A5N3ZYI0_PHOPY|nr:hypothetical protein PPYR_15554 [Photinus pyralis]
MATEKILQWNARGIKNKYDEIRQMVGDIEPIIVAIQESKLQSGERFIMKNYQIFRNDLALEPGQRSHGGVLVMVRNDVHAKTIPLNTSLQAIACNRSIARFPGDNPYHQLGETLQNDINKVTEEAESRGFTFSGMKTRCLHFCRLRHKHEVPTLYLNETPIPNTQEIKFLGIILDSKLTWAKHINHLITKCKIIINRIRVIGSYTWGADRETLSKVINAFIGSRLQYGAEVYTNASKTYMNKIESVWNSALRIVTGAFRTSPIPSLNVESNSLPLRLRFEQQKFKHGVKRCAKPNHFLITL